MFLKLFLYLLVVMFKQYLTLPQYHQNDYDVIPEIGEIVYANPAFATNTKFIFSHYNRTVRAFSGSFDLLVPVIEDLTGTIQLLKFASNEYREFPLRVGINLCHEYDRNNINIKEILANKSNAVGCPAPPGYYYFKDLVFDYSRFPPFIPRGRYKGVGKLYHKSEFVGEGHVYFEIRGKPMKW